MIRKPIHDIQVTHKWSEHHRTVDERGATTVHELCGECGRTRAVLDFTSVGEKSVAETSPEEWVAFWRSNGEKIRTGIESLAAMWDVLLESTQYSSIDGLINHLGRRYQGVVDGRNLPFRELQQWIALNNKKQKLKMLLIYQQGHACNRCDNILLSRQLTIDHIDHNRSNSKLTNLQLLCESCHNKKGDKSPGPKDISPFVYTGEACLHPITCVQLNAMVEARDKAHNAVSL